MTTIDWSKPVPQDVTDIDIAFGGSEVVRRLMPPMEQIPKFARRSWAARLFSDLFFFGGNVAHLAPKPGIDKRKAVRHIQVIMRSFAPKHEHKEAAYAYLFASWFEEPSADVGAK